MNDVKIRLPDPPPEGQVRMRMNISYDGAPFFGFARNEGVATVAATLEDALREVLGHPVVVACAGRTDKGVHARGQVISFDAAEDRADPLRLVRAINAMCGPSIAARGARVARPEFDARRSCVGRVYRYRILNSLVPDPLVAALSWHVERPLDLDAMRVASDRLLGDHDFSSFCRKKKPAPVDPQLVRTIRKAAWWREGDILVFEIEARSFCHQMVRSLVGTLVDIGLGKRKAAQMGSILAARDRTAAASPAPAKGLVLWAARYPT